MIVRLKYTYLSRWFVGSSRIKISGRLNLKYIIDQKKEDGKKENNNNKRITYLSLKKKKKKMGKKEN